MEGHQALDDILEGAHRFLGPKVRRVMLPEDGPVDQFLGAAAPNGVMARAATATTSSPTTAASACVSNDQTNTCQQNVTSASFTLPIALGVALPLAAAIIVLFYLHRRHVRRMKLEDANDPHKSLDFGLGGVPGNQKGRKGGAEMAISEIDLQEKPGRLRNQKSMDLDMVSPYLLPPELQNSRESLHSLSRTIHQQEDPYRPISNFVASDAQSYHSYSRPKGEGSSIYTGSSGAPSRFQENPGAELLSNAAGMPRSSPATTFTPPPRQNSLPQRGASMSPVSNHGNTLPQLPVSSEPPYPMEGGEIQVPQPTVPGKGLSAGLPSNPRPEHGRNLSAGLPIVDGRESYMGNDAAALRNSNNYLGAFINAHEPTLPASALPPPAKSPDRIVIHEEDTTHETPRKSPPAQNSLPVNPRPVRQASLPQNQAPQLPPLPQPQEAWIEDGSDYGDGFHITPPSPGRDDIRAHRYSMDVPPEEFVQAGLGAPGFDARRLSMGFRPLPPEGVTESDDPEVRANRIRSFYKEYFDESKPAPQGQYYEDYDQNYVGDAGHYDHNQNNFVMPYAQPVTRRAMTPPPQSQRFMGPPPRAFHGSMGGYGGPGMVPPGPRSYSSASGRMPPPGPRPYSSASGRGRQGPRKPIPAPAALNTLPTPSKLRDDSFALMGSIEFAPPTSYKERQAGRSQSPLGERRAYSPAVPVYKPLASTYDDLPSMPSPHLLRKSGTFTGLDFAPPRRIRDPDTGSDAGSIRSNRSGVSTRTQQAIRTGAYRVSRLPGDTIFAKDEMAMALKPSWKVGS